MRAARERAGLTQEQVAERVNVSIHTLRRWDQGRNRPSRPEQMQLLAAVLGTRIGVIWPATDDPLVAEALRLEEQRGVSPVRGPSRAEVPGDLAIPRTDGANEVRARRLKKAPVVPKVDGEPQRVGSGPEDGLAGEDASPGGRAWRPAADVGDEGTQSGDERGSTGGLPPWPAEDPDDETLSDGRPVASEPVASGYPVPEKLPERRSADNGPASGGVTLLPSRPSASWRLKRAILAIGAAAVIGGVGVIAASALGERAADADPPAHAAEQAAQRERAVAAARARDVATMRAAADRGDYDAAIVQARQLDDAAAVAAYRESAAGVLVGRADKAARRGDLSLARSRLRAAKRRYESAPGADAVQKRIRRIERQRKERAQRQRAAARRAAAAAALAAQQRAAANAASARDQTVTNAPAPSTSSAPQPSTAAPSSSSSSKGSGSGGGSGKTKDPEEAVDPGLF